MVGELNTWQEIALVAGPVAAAIAALASWASVLQTRRDRREASEPRLRVQKIIETQQGTIGAIVTNIGGGAAVGAGIYLAHPPYCVRAALSHGVLLPGEAQQLWTGIPATEAETDVLVFCRDKDGFAHHWNALEQHRVYKTRIRRRPKFDANTTTAWRHFHPEVGIDGLSEVVFRVTPVTR